MKPKSKSKRPRHLSHKLLILCTATIALHRAALAGEIKVVAYSEDSDKGQPGVLVQLQACQHHAKNKIAHTTGPDGACVFNNLSPGTYCLTFDKTNYTIIVPSTKRELAAAASSATEEVRTYRDGSLVSPNSVITFLQHRAAGDATRYAADVEALRIGRQLDAAKLTLVAQRSDTHQKAAEKKPPPRPAKHKTAPATTTTSPAKTVPTRATTNPALSNLENATSKLKKAAEKKPPPRPAKHKTAPAGQ